MRMRKIKIVADSAADCFRLAEIDLAVAPLKIVTDESEFIDNADLDVSAFVDYMDQYKGKSHSSCPNVDDWLEAFGDADDVLCVTITSGLSGSYNSACMAKEIYESENEGRRVFVIDSLSAGPEITLIVRMLERSIEGGTSFDEICAAASAYQKSTALVFMLKSLKTFANNGRVSPILAKAIRVLGISIVGKASDVGTLEPKHKCRGEKRSLEALFSLMIAQDYAGGRVSIGHCKNEGAALSLRERILEQFPSAEIEIHPLMGLCSFYAEKGGILVGFEKSK